MDLRCTPGPKAGVEGWCDYNIIVNYWVDFFSHYTGTNLIICTHCQIVPSYSAKHFLAGSYNSDPILTLQQSCKEVKLSYYDNGNNLKIQIRFWHCIWSQATHILPSYFGFRLLRQVQLSEEICPYITITRQSKFTQY